MFQASDTIDSEYCSVQPEKNLIAAVMQTAVHDLRTGKGRDTAIDWFKGILDAPLTFKMCCEALGLSPKGIIIALQGEGLLESEQPRNEVVRDSYKFLGAVGDFSPTAFL